MPQSSVVAAHSQERERTHADDYCRLCIQKEKTMREFLAVAGPIVATFVLWSGITLIPMHAIIMFALVVISGVLMLCGIAYFRKIADKDQ
jgi:uncharacterized membrane protein